MSRKLIIIAAVALVAVLFFTGCELSASNSIPLVSSPMGGNSTNSGSTGIPLVQQWGTTTAIYQQTASAQGLVLSTTTPQPGTTTTPNSTVNLLTSIPPTGGAVTTTTTPFYIATVTPGRPANYTLKLGEYPYCIARRFNVNQNDLLAANNLSIAQAGDLPVGTTLIIPQSAGPFIGARQYHVHPATFIVGSTDPKITTIYGVACYYGDIDPTVIAAANGISLTAPLSIGRTISIP